MGDKDTGSRERPKGRTAETVDAITEGAREVARWSPQQALVVSMVLLLSFLCLMFAAQIWISQEQAKSRDREIQAAFAAQMRENNAQAELARVACEHAREKAQRAADEREARIIAAFLAEGDKSRAFWAQENEKFRREVVAAVKNGKP
jgi:hypothetical protein